MVVASGTASIFVDTGSGWGSARVSATVNGDFDAGYTGLFVASNGGVSQLFDDFTVGIDKNADGDYSDPGEARRSHSGCVRTDERVAQLAAIVVASWGTARATVIEPGID